MPRSKGQTCTASSSHTDGASVNTAKRSKVDFLSADGKRHLVGGSSSPSLAVLVIFIASYTLERFLSECSIAQPSQVTLNLRWQLTKLRPLWITNGTDSTCQKERPYERLIDCSSLLLTVNSSKGRDPVDPFPTCIDRPATRLELLCFASHHIKSTEEYITHWIYSSVSHHEVIWLVLSSWADGGSFSRSRMF